MKIEDSIFMDYFLTFSVAATGFSQFDLEGTGQAQLYFDTVRDAVGATKLEALCQLFNDQGLESVFASEALEPIARNIIKLWYIATWDALKTEPTPEDATRIVAPEAYTEGLLWPTIGVNPPAAKAQGYASWANKPSLHSD